MYMELDPIQKPAPEVLEFEKNCDKTETGGFRFWKNLAQTRTRRTVTEILKCQNRTGGSLEKEEPQNNTTNNWDPN